MLHTEFVKIPVNDLIKGSRIEYIDGEVFINGKLFLSPEEMEDLDVALKQETFSDKFFDSLEKCRSTGEKIKFWRKYRKISQEDLAEAIEVKQAFISSIENGNKSPSVKTLIALSEALDCDIDDLIV